jgi:hypothetical protein
MTDHGELSALRDRIRDLEHECQAHAALTELQHSRTQALQRHLLGDVDYWEDLGKLATLALERIQNLERELEKAKARAVEWVSAEERLPPNGVEVQVFVGWSMYKTPVFDIGRCYGGSGWRLHSKWNWCDVKAWAPLPNPPDEVSR